VWMTADRTSPYALFQFWLNTEDGQVMNYLKTFTFLPKARIEELEASHLKEPGAREAHRALAVAVTELLHGPTERTRAEAAAKALFSGDIAGLSAAMLDEVFANVPSSGLAKARLEGEGIALIDLLVETNLAQSKREAKEFLQSGSVSINGRKAGLEDRARSTDLLHGRVLAIRRGKKNWHVSRLM